jgi:hypothetical protein
MRDLLEYLGDCLVRFLACVAVALAIMVTGVAFLWVFTKLYLWLSLDIWFARRVSPFWEHSVWKVLGGLFFALFLGLLIFAAEVISWKMAKRRARRSRSEQD